MELKRSTDESYIEYSKRITRALDNKLIDYSKWGDLLLGVDNTYGVDNLRKASYFVSKFLKRIDTIGYATDDELKNLELMKEELYKERCKLQDQRREYNKNLREQARFENLVETLLERFEDLPELKVDYVPRIYREDNSAMLLCSDWHYGLKIDNQLNYFDSEVCRERVEELTSKAIDYCELHKVNHLSVCLAGDFFSGVIQQSARIEQEEDVVAQLMDVTELIARMLHCLAQHISDIKVYGVWGNHSRIVANKKESLNRENLERIIPFYLKERFKEYNNVKIFDSYTDDYIQFNIGDRKCVLSHGDKDGKNVLNNYIRLLGYVPDEIFIGHRHNFSVVDDCDTDIIVNGSLCGTDDYAVSLRKANKPCQILRVYNGNDICNYKLTLS